MSATKFKDYLSREWDLALTIPRLRLVKSELETDLLNLHKSPELLQRLEEDQIFLVDVISVLLTDEIHAKQLNAESFAAGLAKEGQCQPVIDAADALIEAITLFSPPEKARAMKEIWTKTQTLTRTTLTHMARRANTHYGQVEQAVIQRMDAEFDRSLQEICGTSLKSGAESSDSTLRIHSPSDSSISESEEN